MPADTTFHLNQILCSLVFICFSGLNVYFYLKSSRQETQPSVAASPSQSLLQRYKQSIYFDPTFSGFIAFSALMMFYNFNYWLLSGLILAIFLPRSSKAASVFRPLCVAFLLVMIFFNLFYHFTPLFWHRNIEVDLVKVAPAMRNWYYKPRDGAELSVFYSAMLVVFGVSLLIEKIRFLKTKALWAIKMILIVSACFSFTKVGLIPPFFQVSSHFSTYLILGVLFFASLSAAYESRKAAVSIFIAILLVPICFIPTGPPLATSNYAYIFDPALKILWGYPLSEIYFQYDLLLSLIALPFLALKANPDYMQLVGQVSIYALFLGLFWFARDFFINKILVIPFILMAVFVRMYGSYYDPTYVFQITPLRLDWWIAPLFLSYRFGLFNWRVGLSLGLLLFFHQNFGVIYTLAYIELIALLFLLDLTYGFTWSLSWLTYCGKTISKYVQQAFKSTLVIAIMFLLSGLVYKRFGLSEAAKEYQLFGFGFDRILQQSFYWYVPLLISVTGMLILRLRRSKVSEKYFVTGFFIILLAIGNSLYFYGRSHESNIIWISGSILLVAFIFFDLLLENYKEEFASYPPWTMPWNVRLKRSIVMSLPLLFFMVTVYCYSDRLSEHLAEQYHRVADGRIIQMPSTEYGVAELKKATQNSDKVFVMDVHDFYIYYYGNYNPVGYTLPYDAWIWTDELVKYLQSLLDQDYYLVSGAGKEEQYYTGEVIDRLHFDNKVEVGKYFVMSKNSAKHL